MFNIKKIVLFVLLVILLVMLFNLKRNELRKTSTIRLSNLKECWITKEWIERFNNLNIKEKSSIEQNCLNKLKFKKFKKDFENCTIENKKVINLSLEELIKYSENCRKLENN